MSLGCFCGSIAKIRLRQAICLVSPNFRSQPAKSTQDTTPCHLSFKKITIRAFALRSLWRLRRDELQCSIPACRLVQPRKSPRNNPPYPLVNFTKFPHSVFSCLFCLTDVSYFLALRICHNRFHSRALIQVQTLSAKCLFCGRF